MAINVVVVNTFRNALASGVESDQHYRAFESHVTKLLSRAASASKHQQPIVFVASNNGLALARLLDFADLKTNSSGLRLTITPEPTPRPYQGPACLHVLAAALGLLETVLPTTSAAAARVLFLTPWHCSQDDANDGEDWSSVLEEISSCLDRSGGAGVERVKSCDFVLVQMQADDSEQLERSCLARLTSFVNETNAEEASLSRRAIPLTVEAASLSEDSFTALFRRVLGWGFEPRPVQLLIDPGALEFSTAASGAVLAASGPSTPALPGLTLHCELRPAVWTVHEWWHEGLSGLKASGLVQLTSVDSLRLSCGAVFALAPSRGAGGHPHSNGRQLPRGALRENRSMFSAVCAQLAKTDRALVLRCPAQGSGATAADCQPEEVWLLHCEPAAAPQVVEEHSRAAEGHDAENVWESAILQQLMPAVCASFSATQPIPTTC